jgi:predicted nucleotidyltransferase
MKPSEALQLHRDDVRRIVASGNARNPRVFGSVLRGDDADGSDLDILVDPTPETSIFDIGEIRYQLRTLLGVPVDVLTPNALHARLRERVIAEARPL